MSGLPKKRVAVVTFPGSNCDADARRAVEVFGMEPVAVWHKDTVLPKAEAVILPGGFSYGDYLRCGAIARFSPIMPEVVRFAGKGGPVLGICNGFQVLCEVGLVPGVLLRNSGLKFLCQDVTLRMEGRPTPWTQPEGAGRAEPIRIPIAHMEGHWFADDATLARVEGEGQVVFRYAGGAPNGALRDVAGVCSAGGNVVGLMPHPERYVEADVGGTDGRRVFERLVEVLG